MAKTAEEKYLEWSIEKSLSIIERNELKSIANDKEEILDRFSLDLEFGTGGLRGVMGLGTNRMNKYVIRHATQGLANYLLAQYKNPSIAIAYDSRNNSRNFAFEAATVLAANKIKVHIYKELMPTPSLSFAVRYLGCSAGIVITASHNPKQYNGYKVYGSDGCQMTITAANAVYNEIEKIDTFKDVKLGDFDKLTSKGLINFINEDLIQSYFKSSLEQSIDKKDRILNLAYTPLNGAGYRSVTTVLNMDGFKHIDIVEEQRNPDGNFTTCPYPNPEMPAALELGIKKLLDENDDILIATDPDSDRVGVVVNQKGKPIILTGNEVGILLFDFIYQIRKEYHTLPNKPVVVKTIVSSDLVNIMAKEYGVEVKDVLTGFKFIGEQMLFLEQKDELDRYIFGFEESCGYLTNKNVRDKDAVNAALLVAEMANYYKHQGITLFDKLQGYYKKYGDYKTMTLSFEFDGLEGKQKIKNLMKGFRGEQIKKELKKVDRIGDYLEGQIHFKDHSEPTGLPNSDVIKFFLSTSETITIRPSGTEPKLKVYIFANGERNLKTFQKLLTKFIEEN